MEASPVNNSAFLTVVETKERHKWRSPSAATVPMQVEQQHGHWWGVNVGRTAHMPAGHYLALFSAAPQRQLVSHWSPKPNVSVLVSPAEGVVGENCYEVQIPAGTWKMGDFVPGDLIAYSPITVLIGDPLQCDDISNEFAIEQVERHFQMRDPGEVRRFLCRNPWLADFLIDALAPLNESFVEIDQLVLEVFRDPENWGSSELVCSIVTRLEPHQALEDLNKFDEMWFLDQTDRTQGLLNFRLDFA
jgi:hypothetical protein